MLVVPDSEGAGAVVAVVASVPMAVTAVPVAVGAQAQPVAKSCHCGTTRTVQSHTAGQVLAQAVGHGKRAKGQGRRSRHAAWRSASRPANVRTQARNPKKKKGRGAQGGPRAAKSQGRCAVTAAAAHTRGGAARTAGPRLRTGPGFPLRPTGTAVTTRAFGLATTANTSRPPAAG